MQPIWLTDTVTRDLGRVLHYTLLWGLEGVELRTIGGVHDRVPFVNEDKLKRRLAAHDLPVRAVVPGLFEGDVRDRATWLNEVAILEETLGFCRRIGCTCVVVSAFAAGEDGLTEPAAEALQRAGTVAARRNMTLAVLNEADGTHATGTAMAALLDAVDHPSVQAAWHPAEALRAGEDPAAGLAALGARIGLVRCSDGENEGGTWREQPLGEGAVGWEAHLHQLHKLDYTGPISLEIRKQPAPQEGLRVATKLHAWLRSL